jgi:hypothetical protein
MGCFGVLRKNSLFISLKTWTLHDSSKDTGNMQHGGVRKLLLPMRPCGYKAHGGSDID